MAVLNDLFILGLAKVIGDAFFSGAIYDKNGKDLTGGVDGSVDLTALAARLTVLETASTIADDMLDSTKEYV